MTPTYSREQQIYSLSFSTNSAFGLSWPQSDCKSGMAAMQSYVTKVSKDVLAQTTTLIGTWNSVWGPVVYAQNPTSNSVHADNTMGAYYNPSEQLLVISIAGTNSISTYGWLVQDFSVNSLVEWESITGVSYSGHIAKGTSIGLQILLSMKDDTGNTLLESLRSYIVSNTIPTGIEIAVTGHSLGGALAPTLALYLSDKKATWDPSNKAQLSTYPTAGPTPGDKDFATYYQKQIKANKIAYHSKYNTIDVVPHAWQRSDLAQIPTFYEQHIKPSSADTPNQSILGSLVTLASFIAMADKIVVVPHKNPYQQIQPSTPLQGTFDNSVDLKAIAAIAFVSALNLPKNLKDAYLPVISQFTRFVAQAATQHTTAYYPLLDIVNFMTAYKNIINNNKPKDSTVLTPDELAIKDTLKVDLNEIEVADLVLAYQQNKAPNDSE
ncbi:hypothetical protein [Aureispira sp. CCB-QB1]|uniref:lipase family protein n=1 Tax=Aureispira sp. CCB-QB1 TaxID=1313421 RepID=UPI00069662DD|nr:hypothetical protein [Aureispira sp. CCB-QB1]